ncbi:MAG: prolyl oligopeptidase family serine peptidase [Candidatus Micrarchaeota archaeon]
MEMTNKTIIILILILIAVFTVIYFVQNWIGNLPSAVCYDSDDGRDYSVKGIVTYGLESKTDTCAYCTGLCIRGSDRKCKSSCGAVVEYYCENNKIKSKTYVCGNGSTCKDGACIFVTSNTKPQNTKPSCGNGICEQGETIQTCPDDCATLSCVSLPEEWGIHGFNKCTFTSGSTSEWPILTRYNSATDSYDPYGFDVDPHCQFPFCNEKSTKIDYNEYAFEITADYAPTPDDVKRVIAFIESLGYKVDIYNDVSGVISDGSNPNVQIVNNFRTGLGTTNVGNTKNSLAHFIFPPNFSKKDKLPILVNNLGSGSTPIRFLYKEFGKEFGVSLLLEVVAKSKEAGRTGIIGVIPAAGGQGSQGHNEESLDAFAETITYLKQNFNADNNKIIMFGSSRGGGTTLIRTANPKGHDYNVTALFPTAPPTAVGSMASLESVNIIAIDHYYQMFNGWLYYPNYTATKNAWKYNSKYPPHTLQASACKPLFNVTNIDEADARSAIGYADYQHFGGKYIVLSYGTHDYVIPYHLSIKFDEALRKADIPHKTCIFLKEGHGDGSKRCMKEELEKYVLDYLTKGISPQLPNGRYYYVANITKHTSESAFYMGNENEGITLPFTAIIPASLDSKIDFAGYQNEYIGKQQPADLILVGAKGKSFKVQLLDANHNFLKEWSGIFGQNTSGEEYHVIKSIQFECPDTCDYYWKFWFDGKEISPYNTPFADNSGKPKEAITKVTTWQPYIDEVVKYLGWENLLMGITSIPTCGNHIREQWENELICPEDFT